MAHFDEKRFFTSLSLISAIIITGGDTNSGRSVEILREDGSYWCSLPDLPDDRFEHTQSGLVTCGGIGNDKSTMHTSCLTFTDGQWRPSHQLHDQRSRQSSWMSQQGLVIMGGMDRSSRTTTEILTDNGRSVPYFELKYQTR